MKGMLFIFYSKRRLIDISSSKYVYTYDFVYLF